MNDSHAVTAEAVYWIIFVRLLQSRMNDDEWGQCGGHMFVTETEKHSCDSNEWIDTSTHI